MKQLSKQLDKTFFNSIEEMNECYCINARLPSVLHSNTDLVCYEIVEPFVFEYIGQYILTSAGYYHLGNIGKPVIHNLNEITSESATVEYDLYRYKGRYFVYVRVNEYLRKHLEKTLLGCEFVYRNNKADMPYRRFIHSVEVRESGIVVTDQGGLSGYLSEQLFYQDDHSDPIPYKEWVKKINEQSVEG